MAACSLFEEDEVCHVTPDNTYIYGLVLENAESVSSDEEDSRHEVCKKGCVRVAWHPKGKESLNTPENKVLLADRSLMVADVVRRFVPGQETQCGTVQDKQVTCHLHITGTDKYIYNVDSKQLSSCVQLLKFDNGYVTMDNWLGRVEEVSETVTLLLPDGARCEVDDSDALYLDDISEKRPETATFNDEYWYPGQQLKGELGSLYNGHWLATSLLYNPKNVDSKRSSTFYAVVEKVQVRSIYVYWVCRGYSRASLAPESNLLPPPREVQGADIERLQLVDWFEHCAVNLGNKMYYTIGEEDVLEAQLPKHRFIPYAAKQASPLRLSEITHRTEDLYHQRFDDVGAGRRRGSRKGGVSSVSASSSNATATTVASTTSSSSITAAAAAVGGAEGVEEANSLELVDLSSHGQEDKGAGDTEADADDEYEDIDDKKDSDSDAGSSTSGRKRRKRDRGVGVSIKTLRKTSRQARRAKPVAEIKLTPGSRVATEVCYTFTTVTVLWQDGSVETNIPSVELFPVHHMDELEFFPGSFVIDASASDTSNEYGVVTSCNRFERTCQVKWFKPYELGQSTFPTQVIKDSEVSVYDIHDHPDYKFRPGNSVIRVAGFEDTEQTLQAVGQVMRVDPSGSVYVHWSDGSYTSSYPQDLYIVWDMSDYSNSSWDSEESSSSEEDASDSLDSWETEEEEEEEWKVDAGGDGTQSEEEEWGALKHIDEKGSGEVKSLMTVIQNVFGEISRSYLNLTVKSPDAIHTSATVDPTLMTCLKRLLKMFHSCRRLDKNLKTSFFSTPLVINLVGAIKFDIKKERSNKIKLHLEHIFESSNKSLLGLSKGEGGKTDTAVEASDAATTMATPLSSASGGCVPRDTGLCGARQDCTTVTGSPSKRFKTEDVGTPVDVELGSSVDVVANGAAVFGCVDKGVSPPTVQDVEKDISSRLAAANVAENADKGGGQGALKDAQPGACVQRDPSDGTKLSAEDSKEAASDEELLKQLSSLLEAKLKDIQEKLDEITKAMKGSRRNSTASVNKKSKGLSKEVKSEEDKAKETDAGQPPAGSPAEEGGKVEHMDMVGVRPAAEVDMTAGNHEASDTPPNSVNNDDQADLENGKEDDDGDIANPPGMALPEGFFLYGQVPDCHSYFSKAYLPSSPKSFNTAIRKELKLLRTSLPHGIIVKGYEDRMDLFSVLIDGPSNTPYEDGVFLFDVMLPHDYPTSPPLFHYLSYASDRLNPNLYVDGKVCVSLLGTWSGKGMEVWTSKSNLLQVLVSIQGLILVDQPYYNEAGYEKQRGHQIALENSRVYNEMALLKLVESMTAICYTPPKPFEQEVQERLKANGPRMIARLRKWLSLSESMGGRQCVAEGGVSGEAPAAAPVNDDSVKDSPGSAHKGDPVKDSPGSAPKDDPVKESPASAANGPGRQDMASSDCLPPSETRPGYPPFPLLPMSKGFRLTMEKSLVSFQASLDNLHSGNRSETKLGEFDTLPGAADTSETKAS